MSGAIAILFRFYLHFILFVYALAHLSPAGSRERPLNLQKIYDYMLWILMHIFDI